MIHSGLALEAPKLPFKFVSVKAVLIIGALVFVPYFILLATMSVADQLPPIARMLFFAIGLWVFLLSWLILGHFPGYILLTLGFLALLTWALTRPLNWKQRIMLGVIGVAFISFVFFPYRPAVLPTGNEQMIILTEPPFWLRGFRNAQVFGEVSSCQYEILGWSGPTLLYRADCEKQSQIWQFTPGFSEEPTPHVENLPSEMHKQPIDRDTLLSHLYVPLVYPPEEEYAVRSLFVPDAPLVSPDGRWVAFIARRPYSVQDVIVMHTPQAERTDSLR